MIKSFPLFIASGTTYRISDLAGAAGCTHWYQVLDFYPCRPL
jgi:hypothetical protein